MGGLMVAVLVIAARFSRHSIACIPAKPVATPDKQLRTNSRISISLKSL
jgi:hypothetical protein